MQLKLRLVAALCAAWLPAGCADGFQTLRQAGPNERAIRAAVTLPAGAGPFPLLVVVHGCAGPRPNGAAWAELARQAGFATAIADQHGPLGIGGTCTEAAVRLFDRFRDTHTLVRLMQQRPEIRADRVFVMGFSVGAALALGTATAQWDLMDPPGGDPAPPRPRGAIALYGACSFFPADMRSPLLLLLAERDDWTIPQDCLDWVRGVRRGPVPRIVLLEGAHHAFDDTEAAGPRLMAGYANANRPGGFGATIGYSAAATALARREVLEFLEALR